MSKQDPFKYYKTSPEIIKLAVMFYVRYPLNVVCLLLAVSRLRMIFMGQLWDNTY